MAKRKDNPSEKNLYDREYFKKNREKRRESARIYYLENKEKLDAWMRAYYQEKKNSNKKLWNWRIRKRYIINREKRLEKASQENKAHRLYLFGILGGAFCKRCGFDDWRALQIDHVFSDGNKERKNNKGYLTRRQMRELIIRSPGRYQVLCANCNFIKKHEAKEFSKKRKPLEELKEKLEREEKEIFAEINKQVSA